MQPFNKIQLTTDQFADRIRCKQLDFQSRSLCALITRLAKENNLRLPQGRGIVIQFSRGKILENLFLSDGWWFVSDSTDLNNFESYSDSEKKLLIYASIDKAFNLIGDRLAFDISPFTSVLQQAKKLKEENVWEWKNGNKSSPDKRHSTRVIVKHTMYHFEVCFQVFSKSKAITFQEFFIPKMPPSELSIDTLLGNLRWLSNEEIHIESKIKTDNPVIFHI
jgi:hypothetical protein